MRRRFLISTKKQNNKIWYTSTDNNIVTPFRLSFGANIISNIYENDEGIITFNMPIKYIGYEVFYKCTSLKSITIPDSVTEIGESAFHSCLSLASITIPDRVTSIGDYAFYNCSSLTSIDIPDSVTWIGEHTFDGCTSLTNVTIGNGVTKIGNSAFRECTSLTSVTIPDSVTSIEVQAFYDCTSLTSITIPDSVTEIGEEAFRSCTSLTSFYGKFASEDGKCLIVDNVLKAFAIGCNLAEYTIPDSVTSIGSCAFDGCSSLKSITIPDSVTEIGGGAFSDCSSLTSVHITDVAAWCGITFGAYDANPLGYAHNLYLNGELVTDLIIPDSVTSIGGRAFDGCSSLKSITIPDSVTEIGYQAFYRCYSMESVYCKPTTPPKGGSDMFGSNASGRKIYVPRASVSAYMSAPNWGRYASYIVGYDF